MSPIEPLGDVQIAAYLARIGIETVAEPGIGSLRELQRRHLQTVPFENLSIHLGEPVSLAIGDLFDKIVTRRRGGFCYEVNGLFASLLSALGYRVSLLGGGVYREGRLGPPFDHLALAVDGWLCDAGFGRLSGYPLRLDTDASQDDPCGTFTVATLPGGDLDVSLDGTPQYRLEARPRALADFVPTCWWQQSDPDSHFRKGPVCSRLTETFGTLTLADRSLTSTEGTRREQTVLDTDLDVLRGYREQFGMVLDRVPVPVPR